MGGGRWRCGPVAALPGHAPRRWLNRGYAAVTSRALRFQVLGPSHSAAEVTGGCEGTAALLVGCIPIQRLIVDPRSRMSALRHSTRQWTDAPLHFHLHSHSQRFLSPPSTRCVSIGAVAGGGASSVVCPGARVGLCGAAQSSHCGSLRFLPLLTAGRRLLSIPADGASHSPLSS